ncbi:larval cuticle protein 65Ag1-like [Amphibalanus amphitrite]|uniref:larval cuticle protein 65Ag1-like n=1 Tax=Amphibalanus amphitrite TaxID=1232801 RepID=UPI001C9291B2|nr:larval cuticle protein 65Ag1-like [Amphibalanus amphitrite]
MCGGHQSVPGHQQHPHRHSDMRLLLLAALLLAAAGRPVVEESSPAVEEGSPAVEEGSPAVEEGSPVAEEDSPPDPPVEVLLSSHVQNPDGSFSYSYEQTDGQAVDVRGEQRQIGEEFGTVMRGSYSFVGDDGVTYTVTWVADENGFQAEGDHLPS